MKTFEVTPLGVIAGIPVTQGKQQVSIEVGHFYLSSHSVAAKFDTSRFGAIPERIFSCDVVHGDEVKVLPEGEATVNQCLVYWSHFGKGTFVFQTEGPSCKFLESRTQRLCTAPGYSGAETGYALLAGMADNSSIHLYRRNSGWSRFWDYSLPELVLVATLTVNSEDHRPTVTWFKK